MTQASQQALQGLRDLSMLKWYAIPLLAIVFYIYAIEIKRARGSGNWDAVFSGLTLFGMDFFNETWNGWVLQLSGRSAVWTTPGDTALRTAVGWNIEIIFMFLILGMIYYHSLFSKPEIRNFRHTEPMGYRRRIFGFLRIHRGAFEHRGTAGVGIPVVESIFRRGVVDLPLRLFSFLSGYHFHVE